MFYTSHNIEVNAKCADQRGVNSMWECDRYEHGKEESWQAPGSRENLAVLF